MIYNITGATGKLGKKIVEEALKVLDPKDVILSVRNPDKAKEFAERGVTVRKGDYHSEQELLTAFQNTDVLIYIPSITHPSLPRIKEFENAVIAAEKARVKHFIFIGFIADQENSPFIMSPFFGYVPRRLASSSLNYTYIRNAMYADPLVPYLPELIERGRLLYPVGEGKLSFISRRDIAHAVIKIATTKELLGKRYTLTGEKAMDMVELASILTKVSEKTIKYDPMSKEKFAETYDEPKGFGVVLASLYVAAEKNLMDEVTNDYKDIIGKTPETLEDFISRKYKE
ncbi:SDR family oxidoreductase [Niallia circulans]|uniref:SDR family oxidoreductase n=1 Tax=Niallia circulans TaxID=1397 RepID=UPI001561A60A|nr:SDR family oxidoreductase [Niallia circulans]NRG33090.1 SDR family oxidoreductase [Niallia circulans]